ncbi:hypothetical protein A2U01_0102939, partial [Trifolium medium]|nr:hypothetical protein [Trifolium medium]
MARCAVHEEIEGILSSICASRRL